MIQSFVPNNDVHKVKDIEAKNINFCKLHNIGFNREMGWNRRDVFAYATLSM